MSKRDPYTVITLVRALEWHGVEFTLPGKRRRWAIQTVCGERKWTDREVYGYVNGLADAAWRMRRERPVG